MKQRPRIYYSDIVSGQHYARCISAWVRHPMPLLDRLLWHRLPEVLATIFASSILQASGRGPLCS